MRGIGRQGRGGHRRGVGAGRGDGGTALPRTRARPSSVWDRRRRAQLVDVTDEAHGRARRSTRSSPSTAASTSSRRSPASRAAGPCTASTRPSWARVIACEPHRHVPHVQARAAPDDRAAIRERSSRSRASRGSKAPRVAARTTRRRAVSCCSPRTSRSTTAALGIRVNAICPGFIDTPMFRSVMGTEHMTEYRDEYREHHKLGRFGRPDEIAAAAAVPRVRRRVVRHRPRARRRRRLHRRDADGALEPHGTRLRSCTGPRRRRRGVTCNVFSFRPPSVSPVSRRR